MTTSLVTFGGTNFTVYGDLAGVNSYLLGHSSKAAAWQALDATGKNRARLTATRSFDRQAWVGTVTDLVTPQPLAWPRTGVTDRNGVAIADNVIPPDILFGFYEWVGDVASVPAITGATPGSNTKAVKSSKKVDVITVSEETQFFRATIGQVARFPTEVLEWIGSYLDSAAAGAGELAYASGLDGVESAFTDAAMDFGFDNTGLDGGAGGGNASS